ncbi:hypothetical protein ACFSJY_12145 [Thalassotalea euphylliae]|uniref:hypothetical protein n=1 Tax=Thalassotalea euphylliae TaxID=1655234 RepID=UPI003635627A
MTTRRTTSSNKQRRKHFLMGILATCVMSACNDNSSQKSVDIKQETTSSSSSTKNLLPPDGKTLMIIGQDSDTISEYVANMPEDNIEGVTLYSQLKSNSTDTTLFGIFQSANWQAGDVSFEKTLLESPDAALALGLSLDQCNQAPHSQNLTDGKYDQALKELVNYLTSLAPRKVFLRIGYEFDGPWNCYEPASYKTAFRKIALALDEANANNVATVWQGAAWPDSYGNDIYNTANPDHLDTWYPGDDVVDWVGVSVFYRDLSQWNYVPPTTPDAGQQALLEFARNKQKPVIIAEAAPQGYRIEGLTQSPIQENLPTATTAEAIWQNWYQPFFDFIDDNKDVIRAVAYINANWESQGMWHCSPGIAAGQQGCNQGNWGDSRVHVNDYIKQRWLEQVNNAQRWVQSGNY